MTSTIDQFGKNVFRGANAALYLERQGLPSTILESSEWTRDGNADKVASAVKEWALDHGATSFCHWFQPLGASGVRHGQTACVQICMVEFDREGRLIFDFKGRNLLFSETDGSSYPNGGLRATHQAAGYLTIDPTSPIFLRNDTIFVPACFVSYLGQALDEKTPLHRSCEALNREGTRLLSLLGYTVPGLQTNIGLEQELFLVPREAYLARLDLKMTGRTVMGKFPARGQEMSDHYMAPPSEASKALNCMREIQSECFKLGIPLKTRHREVAPNQYEFAPLYGTVTTQVDQNLMVMQIIDECAAKHGLAALLQEKPFQGVNGSGKHNNWSIGTTDGVNLLNVLQLAEASGSSEIFPVIMAAIISAVDQYGDLMRLSIASPGNDFRLGACEAPPAIISTYLGADMTAFLETYRTGGDAVYTPSSQILNLGSSVLPTITTPAQDRNRTSPFPYGGHRFEFRAVGSSQNVSLVNTVLNTMCAKLFREFADCIEKEGLTPREVAMTALNRHWRAIFNGNGYDLENQRVLTELGVTRIDSGVEAITQYTAPKNLSLFQEMRVLSPEECSARESILLNHYTGLVEVECGCMVDMINQQILPLLRDLQASLPYIPHSPTHCPSTHNNPSSSDSSSSSTALSTTLHPPSSSHFPSHHHSSSFSYAPLILALEHDVLTLQTALSCLQNASSLSSTSDSTSVLSFSRDFFGGSQYPTLSSSSTSSPSSPSSSSSSSSPLYLDCQSESSSSSSPPLPPPSPSSSSSSSSPRPLTPPSPHSLRPKQLSHRHLIHHFASSLLSSSPSDCLKAQFARRMRLEVMEDVRAHCDAAEEVCPSWRWRREAMSTYQDLLFLDHNHSS